MTKLNAIETVFGLKQRNFDQTNISVPQYIPKLEFNFQTHVKKISHRLQ